jgi:hypothetical protein
MLNLRSFRSRDLLRSVQRPCRSPVRVPSFAESAADAVRAHEALQRRASLRHAVRCSGLLDGVAAMYPQAQCDSGVGAEEPLLPAWPVRPPAALRAASFPRERQRAFRPRGPLALLLRLATRRFCTAPIAAHAQLTTRPSANLQERFSVRRLCRRQTFQLWPR